MSLLFLLILGQTPDPMVVPTTLSFAEVKLPDGTVDKNAPSNTWTEYTTTYIPWIDSGYYRDKSEMPESIRTPWKMQRLTAPIPKIRATRGIPSDPNGLIFSYIQEEPRRPQKPQVYVLRAVPQRVTFGNRIQIYVMEMRHRAVEVRTVNGKRYEKEKTWITYATATIGMRCDQDYIPATNSWVERK